MNYKSMKTSEEETIVFRIISKVICELSTK